MGERDTSLDHRSLDWAVEIIGMCEPIRCVQGGMWFGRNEGFPDATFVDYGAADAFAVAANALPALVKVARMAKAAAEMELGIAAAPDFSPREMLKASNAVLSRVGGLAK